LNVYESVKRSVNGGERSARRGRIVDARSVASMSDGSRIH
jgi:hypothetical protein